MSRQSVAILHYSCPPVVGGVEEIVRQQASLLRRYGHPVKVLAGRGEPFSEKVPVEINSLFSSRNRGIMRLQKELPLNWRKIQNLADQILTVLSSSLADADVLLAHNVLTMPYNLPLTLALHQLADQKSIPVVGWNHDSPYFYSDYPTRLDREEWQLLRSPNPNIQYVTISKSRAVEFQRLYGRKKPLQFIPNGIDPIRFFRLDETTIKLIREEHLFTADLLLVQPSRLHPRKNIEFSIRVLSALRKKAIDARFLLTGAYDPHEQKTRRYYQQLMALAEEMGVSSQLIVVAEYRFRDGKLLPADRVIIRDLYLISDLLFLPSLQEGFGIPVLEAGMIKLPIVCMDIPPFRGIAGQEALYLQPGDSPEETAERLLDYLEKQPTSCMFRRVIRKFVWDNIYEVTFGPYLDRITRQMKTS